MKKIDDRLIELANHINDKFKKIDKGNRKEISIDILANIRNFCEAFMYKVYDEEKNDDLYQSQENLKKVREYFKCKYFNIWKFHKCLNVGPGHTFSTLTAEMLLIKYIPDMISLKEFLFRKYNIIIFSDIKKYPKDLDESITSFYKKILTVLLESKCETQKMTRNQYFIRKRSMKYIDGHLFYEYVFDVSDDKMNKFNTFVCYSFKNIKFNYDLKMLLSRHKITFLNTNIDINIIYDYEYSIRPCAFKNLLHIINSNLEISERKGGYKPLMETIKEKEMSLVDIIDNDEEILFPQKDKYAEFINHMKEYIKGKKFGTNIIRYLLLDMKNNVIKEQQRKSENSFSNSEPNDLKLHRGAMSFELMPFAFHPRYVRTSLFTLFELFDPSNFEEEILYRNIVNYINQNNTIFVRPSDVGYPEDVFKELKEKFNNKLLRVNSYYKNCKIIEVNGYFSIEDYYSSSKEVILKFLDLCSSQNQKTNNNYSENKFLTCKQKETLTNSFIHSSVSLITGTAGAGKTTLIKEFIKNNPEKKILCLTTTNMANNNLRLKGENENISYKNISQFEKEKTPKSFDVIIIDEASFVSTKSINKIIKTYDKSAFLIVGDPEQIKSIEFGNWFQLLIEILKPKNVVYTLDESHRTKEKELLKVWDKVRNNKDRDLLETLSTFQMTEKINDSIFNVNENEVVLCLNYDGLYGINNINRYL